MHKYVILFSNSSEINLVLWFPVSLPESPVLANVNNLPLNLGSLISAVGEMSAKNWSKRAKEIGPNIQDDKKKKNNRPISYFWEK